MNIEIMKIILYFSYIFLFQRQKISTNLVFYNELLRNSFMKQSSVSKRIVHLYFSLLEGEISQGEKRQEAKFPFQNTITQMNHREMQLRVK